MPPRAITTSRHSPCCTDKHLGCRVPKNDRGPRFADLVRQPWIFWPLGGKAVNTLSMNVHIHVTFPTSQIKLRFMFSPLPLVQRAAAYVLFCDLTPTSPMWVLYSHQFNSGIGHAPLGEPSGWRH